MKVTITALLVENVRKNKKRFKGSVLLEENPLSEGKRLRFNWICILNDTERPITLEWTKRKNSFLIFNFEEKKVDLSLITEQQKMIINMTMEPILREISDNLNPERILLAQINKIFKTPVLGKQMKWEYSISKRDFNIIFS